MKWQARGNPAHNLLTSAHLGLGFGCLEEEAPSKLHKNPYGLVVALLGGLLRPRSCPPSFKSLSYDSPPSQAESPDWNHNFPGRTLA